MKAQAVFPTISDIDSTSNDLVQLRRHIHQHPELSFEEAETANLVARRLTALGYDVTKGVGGHGVVGSLSSGHGKRSVGIRADMDALPVREETGLPYASVRHGKMHACGHDGHTAMLLGAAHRIASARQFDGTVHLIFQPAEEAGGNSGAARMIADGLFDRFPCDAIFGMHNHPGIRSGTFLFRAGAFMAASDRVTITILGNGGHAARPHLSIDPIVIASSLVMSLQTIVSRSVDPMEPAVVTVGSFQAGQASNVICDKAVLQLSVRSFSEAAREQVERRIRALVDGHVTAYGGHADIEFTRGYPVLVNTAPETELAREVAVDLVGEENVIASFPAMAGSEDFAYFLQQKPGCFLRVGNGESSPMLHNSRYDFDDRNLQVGAAYWARLVERYLPKSTVS